jgi:hypothetical protein
VIRFVLVLLVLCEEDVIDLVPPGQQNQEVICFLFCLWLIWLLQTLTKYAWQFDFPTPV